MRGTVAAQAVGDEAARLVPQPVQQSLEKALCGGGIPAILHEDIEHDPVLVHRPPEIVQHAVDPEYLLNPVREWIGRVGSGG